MIVQGVELVGGSGRVISPPRNVNRRATITMYTAITFSAAIVFPKMNFKVKKSIMPPIVMARMKPIGFV